MKETRVTPERAETVFSDAKAPYTRAQALVEANRCLYCHDAPCITACPTHINIPEFIRKIATDNVQGSARTIFEANILGMSCARVCPVEVLCVGACVANAAGVPPIQIGRLQRYSTDLAYTRGWNFFERGADSGRRVALIGAGPASLACAHELARLGHSSVIFEKRAVPGGLNTTGVAPYKMRADASLTEVDWILGIGGIELRTGIEVVDIPALEAEFDAVFVGIGLGADADLGVPGQNLAGIHGAVAWIEAMKLGKVSLDGVKTALVIGGGNTAIDAVRELKGLGVPEVRMVYRGEESSMSGYKHEWVGARKAAVDALWNRVPTAFVGEGSVRAVRLAVTRDRRPVAGSEHEVAAELVLVAIGQARLGNHLSALGINVDRGRVLVDADGATSRARWYAGGDCANGGTEVVYAAAEGKRAAHAIHRSFGNQEGR